jgi:hypothetical protein
MDRTTVLKVVVLLVLIPIVLYVMIYAPSSIVGSPVSPEPVYALQDDVSAIQAELSSLRGDVAALQPKVDDLSQRAHDVSLNSELALLRGSLDSLDNRLQRIEQTLFDDPTETLQLILLSEDVERLQEDYRVDLQLMRTDIYRLYNWYKWSIGLMVTTAVAVLALVARGLLPRAE